MQNTLKQIQLFSKLNHEELEKLIKGRFYHDLLLTQVSV